jgi:hypothetical protein
MFNKALAKLIFNLFSENKHGENITANACFALL